MQLLRWLGGCQRIWLPPRTDPRIPSQLLIVGSDRLSLNARRFESGSDMYVNPSQHHQLATGGADWSSSESGEKIASLQKALQRNNDPEAEAGSLVDSLKMLLASKDI